MHVSDCPSNEILQALLLGKLPDDESRVYESHIVGCEACGIRTRQIQASDPLLDLLPEVRNVAWSAEDEEQSRQMVDRFSNRSQLLASTAQGGATILTGQIDPSKPDEEALAANVLTQSSISPFEPTSVAVTRAASALSDSSHHTAVQQPAEGVMLGAYRLDRKLGQGGMGTVWKAFHTRLKKPVALKVLSAHLLRDPALVARFEREMEAVGKLDHAAIVRAMDAGEIDGTHYLVMEYVEGTDFGELVKTKGARTVRDACEMVRQAAVGLAYAHKNGLIHRDIKPSNLFLTKDGKVKVLDLGLARLQGEGLAADPVAGLTSTGQILGTPDYMAPEQWENTHTVGPACDLYALGCTIFFLLTGRAPFADEKHPSLAKKMLGHCEHVPPPLSAIRTGLLAKVRKTNPTPAAPDAPCPPAHDIPPKLEAIYERLMAKDPAARFATADQLAAALVEIIKAKPPAPTQVPPVPSPVRNDLPTSAQDGPPAPVRAPTVRSPRPEQIASAHEPDANEPPSRNLKRLLLAFGGLAAALLFGVFLITIKNKDGSVIKLEVEDPAEVNVSRKGDPEKLVTASAAPLSTLDAQPTTWHGWPADAPKPAIAPFDAAQAKRHQEEWAKYLNVPVEYTSPIGMTFRLIPPGEFLMGCTAEDVERILSRIQRSKYTDESIWSSSPRHAVTLTRPFYLGAFEVTQAQYERVMIQNPAFFAASGGGKKTVDGQETADHPVESVPWHDAETFCSKAGRLMNAALPVSVQSPPFDSQSVRLPTEAEWEFACRAGTTTRFWTGDDEEQLKKFAWVGPDVHAGWAPHTVGTRPPNPFGLCDMHGNVYEWVHDSWRPDFYETFRDRPAVDPIAFEADQPHVARGGWIDIAPYGESSVRNARGRNTSEPNIGLRVALSVDSVRQALKLTGPMIPPVKLAARDTTPALPSPGGHKWAAEAPKPAIAPFDAAQAKKHQEEWAAYLKVPVEYTNSIGMKFRLIPPGEFLMGSTPEEIERVLRSIGHVEFWRKCTLAEGPQQIVVLSKPFYLGNTEVTQGQYQQVVASNPSIFNPMGAKAEQRAKVAGMETGEFPVEFLTWTEAARFCDRLSQSESLLASYDTSVTGAQTGGGGGYRLPTDAEWEHACRSGTTSLYSSGETTEALAAAGWFLNNAGERTHQVGTRVPNSFGLFDMHGNVWELTHDARKERSSGGAVLSRSFDPVGSTDPGGTRCLRGGSWFMSAEFERSARCEITPLNNRDAAIGFRVALSLDAVKRSSNRPPVTKGWHGWPEDAPKPAIAPYDAAQARKHQEEWSAYLKVPVEYTNSIGMKFRLIPPGEFLMGATPAEIELAKNGLASPDDPHHEVLASSGPLHRSVLTQPFYIGAHEATQGQFSAVMGSNPSQFSDSMTRPEYIERHAKDSPTFATGLKEAEDLVAGIETTDHPVDSVLWIDAARFLSKLNDKESMSSGYDAIGIRLNGSGYRLPTEAEWEFACRAGTTTSYWKGDQEADLTQNEWTGGTTTHTERVGRRASNPFGLYDMLGNVMEFVEDEWETDYFQTAALKLVVDPLGPQKGQQWKVARGGDWHYSPPFCMCASRYRTHMRAFGMTTGFRAVLTIDAVRQALKSPGPQALAKPGVTPSMPGSDTNSARVDYDAERKAAESLQMLFKVKRGTATLRRVKSGTEYKLTDESPLPTEPFTVFWLDWNGDNITDDDLAVLEGCHQLEGLLANSKFVTDRGLQHLSGLKALKTFHLRSPVTDRVLERLAGLTTLEEIALGNIAWSPSGLAALGRLPKLERLVLQNGGIAVNDEAMAVIGTHLSGLTELNISLCPEVTFRGVKDVAEGCKSLRSLMLGGQKPDALDGLNQHPTLESLSIHSDQITQANGSVLSSLPGLRVLHVWYSLADAQVGHIVAIKQLRSFTIHLTDDSRTPLSIEALKSFGKLPGLESMALLNYPDVTDDEFAALATITKVKNLELSISESSHQTVLARANSFHSKRPDVRLTINGKSFSEATPASSGINNGAGQKGRGGAD